MVRLPIMQGKYLMIDQNLVQQVIFNVLSNAIKFSKERNIVLVQIQYVQKDSESVMVVMKITDNGIGLSENDLQSIFTPYFLSKESESQNLNADGVGLGLSTSLEIAKSLGGNLEVDSKFKLGSTFIFTFKAEIVNSSKSSTRSGSSASTLKKVRKNQEIEERMLKNNLSIIEEQKTLEENSKSRIYLESLKRSSG